MKNEAGLKMAKIIAEELDPRVGNVANMVVTYIISVGWANVEKITEESIANLKGNMMMTAEFEQALVRTAVRITKEVSIEKEFLPYVIKYLNNYDAPTRELVLYREDYEDWKWEELMSDLNLEYEEDAEEITAVTLSAVVMETKGV